MLRNIPNKVDQAMLKEIVDESSFGRYDFMYLRIDFSNNCKYVYSPQLSKFIVDFLSVGYAFINFTDVSNSTHHFCCFNLLTVFIAFGYH